MNSLEQPRAVRDEQPDRQLYRRHVIDEIERPNRVQQIAIVFERQPGMKRDECRNQRETGGTAEIHRCEEILARVPLVEKAQYAVVERFDGARHERAAAGRESRQQIRMLKQMLDLDRDVEADVWIGGAHPVDDVHRVRWTIEEVGVAKCNVVRAGRNLRRDIGQHDVRLDHAELTLIDGHDRAMPAEMLASAARFRGTDNPARAVGHVERRVL